LEFDIIIDGTFLELGIGSDLNPIHNKQLLSIVNDYEDGHWRFEKFNNFVWDNIAETALSHKEREALQAQPSSLLRRAAKNLRLTDSDKDIGKGSELAEIVLYGVMKHKYGALPVVPKIFYKQNTQDNAKGADSVHIVLEDNGGFTLWFGEAKFYNSIEDSRLGSIIQSVANSLATDKLKKENSIITNLSDIDSLDIDEAVKGKIKESLSNANSIDSIKSIINIPILILHECEITASTTELTEDYVEAIKRYHEDRAVSYFSKQISSLVGVHKYEEIRFHLILFPVPKKEPIIETFVSTVKFYKS
jgi:hypothetical protein